MALGTLGYAGQAAIGMDESARRRRMREEEEMQLAQQRRAEAEAQRRAALEAFTRQQQAGLLQTMGTGAAPEMRQGEIQQVATTPPASAGLNLPTPAATTTPETPAATTAPATPPATPPAEQQAAGLRELAANVRGRSAPSLQAGLKKKADALKAQAATVMTPEQIDEQLKDYRAGLKNLPSSRANKPKRDAITAEIKRLEAMKKDQAAPATETPVAAKASAATAPVSNQTVADSLKTPPDAPETQAVVQAANTIDQTAQQVQQEPSPLQHATENPDFVPQIPQAVQQGMSTREKLASMYTEALNAGYPELAAQYYQQISDVDATLVSMYQTQALANLERVGDPVALAGELERSLGVPVTIARKGDRFQVSFGGKKRDYTLEQLREDAKLQFDADYKESLMKSRSAQAMEAFKSQLRINEKQAEAIIQGRVDAMKPFNISVGEGRQMAIMQTDRGVFLIGSGEQQLLGFDGNMRTVNAPIVQQVNLPAAGIKR